MTAKVKILVGAVVVAAALAWLGFVGFQESKSYYLTVAEYDSMRGTLHDATLKLAGEVVAGSINRSKPQMEFLIGDPDHKIKVQYVGNEIIPDTFKDGTKALVEGKANPDGVFQAKHIEAKCASKYEAEYENRNAR